MKRIYTSLLVALLVVAFSSSVLAGGQFVGDRFGPKAHGMGGAFTAVADDASAIYWNPAGLVRSGSLGLQTNAGGSLSGLGNIEAIEEFLDNPEENYSGIDDLEETSIYVDGMGSINLSNFGLGALLSNEFIANKSDDDIVISNKTLGEGIFSIGKELTDMPLSLGSLSVGANAKYLYGDFQQQKHGVDEDNYDYDYEENSFKTSGHGYGLDAGALIRATNMLNVGVNVRNLVSYYDWDEDVEDYDLLSEDEFQRRIRVGAAANLPFPIAATVAGDIDIPDDFETDDMIYHLGAEKDIILGLLSARVGMYGQDDKQNYTAGLGINVPFLDVNIAGDIVNEIEESRYFSVSGTFRF